MEKRLHSDAGEPRRGKGFPIKRRWVFLAGILLIACGCSGIRVSQDYLAGTDFSGLGTYAWQTEKEPASKEARPDDPLMERRIRSAVERTLSSMGFRKAGQAHPDFFVDYRYMVRRKLEYDGVRTSIGIGTWGNGTFGGIGVGPGYGLEAYDEGLLYIDFIDPKSGELFWRGKGSFRAEEHAGPEEATRRVNEVVHRVLAQFPPQDSEHG